MPPPEFGYGPVNFARPGHIDPFAAFDNRIRYNDMIRQQMISQYQQGAVQPTSMTLAQQRHIAMDPRFQYGVPGGQDPRHYQRQAELRRMGTGTAIAKTAMDIGSWGPAAAIGGATIGGIGGAVAFPIVATAAALYMPMRGINNAMARQTFMHGMAADIEQYRDQLGFRGGLSYNQATNLAGSMQRNMYQGGFFNPGQQSQIHKIALSNKMISARGGGAPGSLRQYERNFEELRETTEEVVKLLQTTIEGGMSVIKELQQTGFGGMRQVKSQIRQAKAFGGITGLGAQNMMQIGAAGARAVQGTPWAANVGATMYQSGAAQAATMARMGPAGAYAVQRAGGVAAAGGALANAQMNVLSSGMGTKAVAYAMNASGTVDQGRMARLMGGKVGAYEMVVGASERGYAMGPSGRVMFELNKEDVLNQMSDIGRTQMVNRVFQAWGQGRYGTNQAKAVAFAKLYTNNQRDQRLFAENLLRPKGFDDQYAAIQATRASLNQVQMNRPLGIVGRAATGAISATGGYFNRMGEDIVYGSGRAMGRIAGIGRGIGTGVSQLYEDVLQGVGVYDKYGGINRANPIDAGAAIRSQYGIGRRESDLGARGLAMASPSGFSKLENIKKLNTGIDYGALVSKDPKTAAYLYQQIGGALQVGTAGDLFKNDMVLRGLSATPGSAMFNMMKEQPIAFANSFLATANQYRTSVNKKYENQTTEYERIGTRLPGESQRIQLRDMKNQALFIKEMTGSFAREMTIGKIKTQGIPMGAAGDLAIKQADVEYNKKNSDMAGANLHEKSVDLAKYQKAKREAIYYGTFGFEMEERAVSAGQMRTGGPRTEMVETGATRRRKKKIANILGPGFGLGTTRQQEEAAAEIDRLIATMDKPKLTKLAPWVSEIEGARPEYFGSPLWENRKMKEREARAKYVEAEALDIRTGQANKFMDHLRYNLLAQPTSKQQTQIKNIITGKIRPTDLGAGIVSLLETGAGVTKATIEEEIAAGTIGTYLRKSEPVMSKQEVSEIEKARVHFVNAEAAKTRADNVVDRTIIGRKGKEKIATKKGLEYLVAKEKYEELTQVMSYPQSTRDPGSYTSVQPPILNYWNNKWTL